MEKRQIFAMFGKLLKPMLTALVLCFVPLVFATQNAYGYKCDYFEDDGNGQYHNESLDTCVNCDANFFNAFKGFTCINNEITECDSISNVPKWETSYGNNIITNKCKPYLSSDSTVGRIASLSAGKYVDASGTQQTCTITKFDGLFGDRENSNYSNNNHPFWAFYTGSTFSNYNEKKCFPDRGTDLGASECTQQTGGRPKFYHSGGRSDVYCPGATNLVYSKDSQHAYATGFSRCRTGYWSYNSTNYKLCEPTDAYENGIKTKITCNAGEFIPSGYRTCRSCSEMSASTPYGCSGSFDVNWSTVKDYGATEDIYYDKSNGGAICPTGYKWKDENRKQCVKCKDTATTPYVCQVIDTSSGSSSTTSPVSGDPAASGSLKLACDDGSTANTTVNWNSGTPLKFPTISSTCSQTKGDNMWLCTKTLGPVDNQLYIGYRTFAGNTTVAEATDALNGAVCYPAHPITVLIPDDTGDYTTMYAVYAGKNNPLMYVTFSDGTDYWGFALAHNECQSATVLGHTISVCTPYADNNVYTPSQYIEYLKLFVTNNLFLDVRLRNPLTTITTHSIFSADASTAATSLNSRIQTAITSSIFYDITIAGGPKVTMTCPDGSSTEAVYPAGSLTSQQIKNLFNKCNNSYTGDNKKILCKTSSNSTYNQIVEGQALCAANPMPKSVGVDTTMSCEAYTCKSNLVTCPAGKYLPKYKSACSSCTVGNYCLGGDFAMDSDEDQGLNSCSVDTSGVFPTTWSAGGYTSKTDCLAKLTFRGNGGQRTGSDDTTLGQTFTVGAKYRASSGTSCAIGNDRLCTSNTSRYTITDGVGSASSWTKPGFTFDGWYTNENYTSSSKVTSSSPKSGNQTLYAKWNPSTYPITYHTNGGDCSGTLSGNLISAHPAKMWTKNGITVTTTGNGVYEINGTAQGNWTANLPCFGIEIPINEFTMPVAKGHNGTGSIASNNNIAVNGAHGTGVLLRLGTRQAGYAYNLGQQLSAANRFDTTYSTNGEGVRINVMDFCIEYGVTVDHLVVAPAVYNDGRTSAGDFRTDSRCTVAPYTTVAGEPYSLDYVCENDNNCRPVVYDPTTTTTLATPTKSNYIYDSGGWYANSNLTGTQTKSIAANSTTGAKEYYAKWLYKVRYSDNNGNTISPVNQTSGEPFTPQTFAQTGFTAPGSLVFSSWSVNDSSCGVRYKLKPELNMGVCDTAECAACNASNYGEWSSGCNYLGTPNSSAYVFLFACYKIHCDAGKYAAAGETTCTNTCPAGSYCPGGDFDYYENTQIGITTCPSGYTSDAGAMGINDCYNAGTVACSVANPVSDLNGTVTYANTNAECRTYYGSNTCELAKAKDCKATLTCNTGYAKKNGYAPLNAVDTSLESSNHTSVALNSNAANAGTWTATFDYGTVAGDSLCSVTYGNSNNLLTSVSENIGAPQSEKTCWCRITSFTPNGGSAQTNNSWYFRRTSHGSRSTCLHDCAGYCATLIESNRIAAYKTPEYCEKITVTCDAGYYLPGGSTGADNCTPCLANSYCPGDGNGGAQTYDYSDNDQGIFACPSAFPNSVAGATSNSATACYATTTFDSAGGSDVNPITTHWDGNDSTTSYCLSSLPTSTRSGYMFANWFILKWVASLFRPVVVPTCTPNSTDDDLAGNVTLYANWNPNYYAVTYSCGTGTGTPPTHNPNDSNPDRVGKHEFGTSFTPVNTDGANCSKVGSVFNGWQCLYDGTTVIVGLNDAVYNQTKSATCTAQWKNVGDSSVKYFCDATSTDNPTVNDSVSYSAVGYSFRDANDVCGAFGSGYTADGPFVCKNNDGNGSVVTSTDPWTEQTDVVCRTTRTAKDYKVYYVCRVGWDHRDFSTVMDDDPSNDVMIPNTDPAEPELAYTQIIHTGETFTKQDVSCNYPGYELNRWVCGYYRLDANNNLGPIMQTGLGDNSVYNVHTYTDENDGLDKEMHTVCTSSLREVTYNIYYYDDELNRIYANDSRWSGTNHPDTYTIRSSTSTTAGLVKTGYTFAGWCPYKNAKADTDFSDCTRQNYIYWNGKFGDYYLYAQWTPKNITCPAGQYMNHELGACKQCESGYYCPGNGNGGSQTYVYDDPDADADADGNQGRYSCNKTQNYQSHAVYCDANNPETSSNYSIGWYGYPEYACAQSHINPHVGATTTCPVSNIVIEAQSPEGATNLSQCYLDFTEAAGTYLHGNLVFSGTTYGYTDNVQMKSCPKNYYCPGTNVTFAQIDNLVNSFSPCVDEQSNSDNNVHVIKSGGAVSSYVGAKKCPTAFPNSDDGSDETSDCYAKVVFYADNSLETVYTTKLKSWNGNVSTTTYTMGADLPSNPSREGYDFAGWWKVGVNTRIYATNPTLSGDIQAYAKWTLVNYTIEYDTDGGSCRNNNCSPTSYNITSANIKINTANNTPTKTGHTLIGWCVYKVGVDTDNGTNCIDTANFVGTDETVIIPTGSTGNRKVYAIWQANQINLKWFYDAIDTNSYEATMCIWGTTKDKNDNPDGVDGDINVPQISRPGYVFNGWILNSVN